MLVVAVAILVLAYFATRWIAQHGTPGMTGKVGAASGRFSVLAQIAVGRNERLLLVRLGDRCCLLGVTEHGITLLKELEEEESREWLNAASAPASPTFVETLSSSLHGKK
jgi:flagellar biosynthetic protein FliO